MFHDVFGQENLMINEEANPDNFEGWDSFIQISILESVRNEFSINFILNKTIKIKSVGDIFIVVWDKVKGISV